MRRSVFGWDLPPGCTHKMIDDLSAPQACEVCGKVDDDCICPVCPVCQHQGNINCYREITELRNGGEWITRPPHMVISLEQQASMAAAEKEWAEKESGYEPGDYDEDTPPDPPDTDADPFDCE